MVRFACTVQHYKNKAELSTFTFGRRGKFHRPQFFLLSDKRLNYTKQRITPYVHTIPYQVTFIEEYFFQNKINEMLEGMLFSWNQDSLHYTAKREKSRNYMKRERLITGRR